jgi:hypothetical protein
MKPLARTILSLTLLIPIATSYAGSLGNYPADETCKDARAESYAQGFAAGDANGYARGYSVGFGDGSAAGIAQCVADPQSCNITLASCIPDATYGETEPNDNLITADPLKQGVNFWGQNYSGADQDWFYTETTKANQNLLVTFSVPEWIAGASLTGGVPSIWNVTVRDAAGNVFADFDSNVVGGLQSTANAVTYSVTLGLAGSYYIVVQPKDKTQTNAYSYSIAAIVQDSNLDTTQPIVGFYDSEVEPNNVPSRSNPLATGVSMYGLINLTFNSVVPDTDGTSEVWGQGENDWYVYYTDGSELVTLTVCAKEACGAGNWYIEVYDQASAQKWQELVEAGSPTNSLEPLLAFNTDTSTDPTTFRIGLKDPGYYFMRVNHKRLFTATCNEYRYMTISGAPVSGASGICTCDTTDAKDKSSTGSSCYIPTDDCSEEGSVLSCKNVTATCTAGFDPGCVVTTVPAGCGVVVDGEIKTPCSTYQTSARCSCSNYGGVVEIPANEYTSPYNFTWYGTKLPTNTIDTDAYDDYLDRSTPYN